MFSYLLLFLTFLNVGTETVISDPVLTLFGPTIVRADLDHMSLNCSLQDISADQSVYQMSILKGKEVLAKINEDGKITVLKQDLNLDASGFKDSSAGKVSLNLTINNPRKAMSSKYSCAATIFDEHGYTKLTSKVVPITVKVPSESEINLFFSTKIRGLEKLLTNLSLALQQMGNSQITTNLEQVTLKNDREKDEKTIKDIKSTMAEKKDIDNLKSIMVDKKELNELKSKLDSFINTSSDQSSGSFRIETGSISCNSTLDQPSKNWRYGVTNVTFSSPFSKTPRLAVGLRATDIEGPVRLYGKEVELTKSGFLFHCYTWDDTVHRWALYNWIAFE